MSLKRNIVANYASQLYVTGSSILILPLYIQYMGAEAYGLVGFFAMLQAWFNLLDLGLTPTISRETARFRVGSIDSLAFRQLFRALSSIFIIVAVVGGTGLFVSSTMITNSWLNLESLNNEVVVIAVKIIAICVALRWLGGLYRGVITGSEKLVWLSSFNAIIATLRFIGVLTAMYIYGYTVLVFFTYQFVIALIELFLLWYKANLLLPKLSTINSPVGWSLNPVKRVLKFSLMIAFTSSMWVLVTQTDKLILSGILTLSEYGYFTLAVLVASAIAIVSGPISNALLPRMASLYAQNNHEKLIGLYRRSTQLVTILAGSASISIAFCSQQLLFSWTGDIGLAEKAAPILQLYAIGNGFLAVAAFPYYLQYAKGDLRYHFIGNIVFSIFLIPSIIFAAYHYGGIGAGYAWLISNAVYFFVWVAYVHKKLEPGLHVKWLTNDVLLLIIPPVSVGFAFTFIDFNPIERMSSFIYIVSLSALILLTSLISSSVAREYILKTFKKVQI